MKLIFSNLSISSLLLNSFKMANIPSVDLSCKIIHCNLYNLKLIIDLISPEKTI